MAEDNFVNPIDFPIMAVDGAYLHFLDDYVSLILYQNRLLPPKDTVKSKPTLRREIVIDARLSIPTLKHIMMSATDGLKHHALTKLVEGHPSQWIDTTFADKHLTNQTTKHNVNKIDEIKEEVLSGYFIQTLQMINEEGVKKIHDLFEQFLSDNIEKIKNIRIKYVKENGEKNVSKTK